MTRLNFAAALAGLYVLAASSIFLFDAAEEAPTLANFWILWALGMGVCFFAMYLQCLAFRGRARDAGSTSNTIIVYYLLVATTAGASLVSIFVPEIAAVAYAINCFIGLMNLVYIFKRPADPIDQKVEYLTKEVNAGRMEL